MAVFRAFNRESGETGWSKAGKEQEVRKFGINAGESCVHRGKEQPGGEMCGEQGSLRSLHTASQMKAGEQSGVTF